MLKKNFLSAQPSVLGGAVFLLTLITYLLTLSQTFSNDSDFLNFARYVETPATDPKFAAHLLWVPLARLFLFPARAFGFSGPGIFIQEAHCALWGALGAFLFFFFLLRATNDKSLSFLTALILAFSYSSWKCATGNEMYVLSVVFLIPALFFSINLFNAEDPLKKKKAVLPAAAFLVLAALSHWSNIIFLAPLAILFILHLFKKPETYKTALHYSAFVLLFFLIAVPLLFLLNGIPLPSLLSSLSSQARYASGQFGECVRVFPVIWFAIWCVFYNLAVFEAGKNYQYVYTILGGYALAFLPALLRVKYLWRCVGIPAGFCLFFLLAGLPFFARTVPENENIVILFIPFFSLLALSLNGLKNRLLNGLVKGGLALLVLVIFLHNLPALSTRHDGSEDAVMPSLKTHAPFLRRSDLLVAIEPLEASYYAYFAGVEPVLPVFGTEMLLVKINSVLDSPPPQPRRAFLLETPKNPSLKYYGMTQPGDFAALKKLLEKNYRLKLLSVYSGDNRLFEILKL